MRAFNAGGFSKYSNEASATTFPAAPESPANLLATVLSSTQIKLAWEDRATNEDSFRLERRLSANEAFKPVAVLAANAVEFTDTGLSASTLYFYRLQAINRGGGSAYSNEAGAMTLVRPPVGAG